MCNLLCTWPESIITHPAGGRELVIYNDAGLIRWKIIDICHRWDFLQLFTAAGRGNGQFRQFHVSYGANQISVSDGNLYVIYRGIYDTEYGVDVCCLWLHVHHWCWKHWTFKSTSWCSTLEIWLAMVRVIYLFELRLLTFSSQTYQE